jgi:hypothetical protein
MKIDKANKRDRQRNKRRYGMRSSGKSVFLIREIIIEKGKAQG